jgi:23S rRNA U2552 (ribose-2'-O)-methylase RlmE/FtsJ
MIIKNYKLFLEELVGEKPIADYDVYNKGMAMSSSDKLFFLNKVDADVIVDFGCANGFILQKIKESNPNITIIGYDLDQNMLDEARKKVGDDVLLTTNWNEVLEEIKKHESPLLLLSSVIHEVYSYSHSKIVKKFWESQVFGNNFKWVAIRDMMPSIDIKKQIDFQDDLEKIKEKSDPEILSSFEKRWGTIDNYRTMIHYLLKYRYIENWAREVNENYLPITVETFKKKIPSGWRIIYEEEFSVKFLTNQIRADFGINLNVNTHAKFVLRNTKFKK